MLQKPKSCVGCTLYTESTGFSNSEGRCSNGVLIVGEALGANEVLDALPFRPHAEAGSALHSCFRILGYERSNFGFWNMIGCQPPYNALENTNYEYEAIEHCREAHFNRVLAKFKPKIILALGNVPLKHLWKKPEDLQEYIDSLPEDSKEDKKFKKNYMKNFLIGSMRGYVLPSIFGIPMIASFHPSHINYEKGRPLLGVLMQDLTQAMNVARNGVSKFDPKYVTNPTKQQLEEFLEECRKNPNLPISHDIETPYTALELDESEIEFENQEVRDIDSIQFSIHNGTGIFVNWNSSNIDNIRCILRLPNPKIGWNNWKFDEINLNYHLGNDAIAGDNHDVMWMWKWLNQDFVKTGRALQFATNFAAPEFPVWKHLSQMEKEKYGCLHSESRIALANGNYLRIRDIVTKKLGVEVKGMDEEGKIIPTKIIGWRKIPVIGQKWFEIHTDATDQPIYCTPDHEIWVDDVGWVKAENISKYDRIRIDRIGNNDVIHGTLLGDAHVDKRGRLSFCHSVTQKSWFNAKRSAIAGPEYYRNIDDVRIKDNTIFRRKAFYRTEIWVSKNLWRRTFYTKIGDAKLFVPPSNKALAVWYGDDGTLANKDQPRINIYNSFYNRQELFEWFYKEFGKENVSFYEDNRGCKYGGCIALKGPAKTEFFKRIHTYLHPAMSHKLPTKFKNKYNNWMETDKHAQVSVVTGIFNHKPSREERNRYCITVEHPTHRFFTMGGLVKNCLDVDATLRIFNHLKKTLSKMRLDENSKSLWEGYMDDVVYLRPILKDMSKRGFPIDPEERAKFRELLEDEQEKTLTELQEEYPMELRRLNPTNGYKTIPQEVIDAEDLFNQAKDINNDGPFYILDSNDTYNIRFARYIEKHTRKPHMTGLVVREFDEEGFKTKRYCRMEEFKPSSPNQVLDYLKFKGYKIPKIRDKKKGERETTDKSHLQPLWEETGDDLLYKCIYMRELDNLKNTFIDGQPLRSDNRVEAEFLPLPATGQLSTSPNIQNYAARGTKFSSKNYGFLANQLRKTVQAKSGHTLISADWSAFHINTLSYEANDSEFMRIGRLDPHTYLTAHMLKADLPSSLPKLKKQCPQDMEHDKWIEMIETDEEALIRLASLDNWLDYSDDDLLKELKWLKSKKHYKFIRDAQAKRALFGMGFGMGVRRFYKENRYVFKSLAEPERIIKKIKKLWPKTFTEYHEYIKNLASNQTYLLSRYGYIRRFFDVYDYRLLKKPRSPKEGELIFRNKKNEWWSRRDGSSAKEAIAYLPANDAFAVKKEKMRMFWNHPNGNLIKAYGLINDIHDDLMWECEDGLLKEALPIIKGIMESPGQYLKSELVPAGLVTKVEIKLGKNWAPFNDDKEKGEINLAGMKEIIV